MKFGHYPNSWGNLQVKYKRSDDSSNLEIWNCYKNSFYRTDHIHISIAVDTKLEIVQQSSIASYHATIIIASV